MDTSAPPFEAIPAGPVTRRPPRIDDVDDIVAACNDPLVQRFVPVPGPYTRDHAMDWITKQVPADGAAGGIQLAIVDPASDRMIGAVGIQRVQGTSAEIGYWVAPWARRRGAAVAATRAPQASAWRILVTPHDRRVHDDTGVRT